MLNTNSALYGKYKKKQPPERNCSTWDAMSAVGMWVRHPRLEWGQVAAPLTLTFNNWL